MDRHADAVHRLLLSLGAAPDDAEDALQDCFVSAWRSAGTFQGGDSARGWLFTIARNALRRQHRRRAGEPTTLDSLESLGAAAGWGSESDFSHRLEVEEELEWALGHIPEEERQVVVLRDLEGLSGEETAEVLELSLAAMKSRLHRGRLRLMGVVRGEGTHG
jgi:RNA polymerase sigma-70 factor (ECF subfamily)